MDVKTYFENTDTVDTANNVFKVREACAVLSALIGTIPASEEKTRALDYLLKVEAYGVKAAVVALTV
jgi:hypothetical protein